MTPTEGQLPNIRQRIIETSAILDSGQRVMAVRTPLFGSYLTLTIQNAIDEMQDQQIDIDHLRSKIAQNFAEKSQSTRSDFLSHLDQEAQTFWHNLLSSPLIQETTFKAVPQLKTSISFDIRRLSIKQLFTALLQDPQVKEHLKVSSPNLFTDGNYSQEAQAEINKVDTSRRSKRKETQDDSIPLDVDDDVAVVMKTLADYSQQHNTPISTVQMLRTIIDFYTSSIADRPAQRLEEIEGLLQLGLESPARETENPEQHFTITTDQFRHDLNLPS